MNKTVLRSVLIIAAICALPMHTASAAIHRVNCVSGPFLTIQSAVTAAANGDTILVNGCTYNENVVVSGFNRLHIVAADQGFFGAKTAGVGPVPPIPNAVVTGGGLPGPCFSIDNSSDVDIVGFFLRGCAGGGVVITGCNDILIESNFIVANGGRGIHAIGTFEGTYTGNFIALMGLEGIFLEDTILNTVADNFIIRSGTAGIFMLVGVQNRIVNNDSRMNNLEGIVASGNEPRIERNSLSGNGGVAQLLIDPAGSNVDAVGNASGAITDLGVGTELMDNF